MDDSDDQLAVRARTGDEQALSILLERAGLELQSHLQRQIGARYRGQFDADDILQVTFLEAFLRIASFSSEAGTFTGWLRRIAENNLRDAIRQLERDKRPSPGKRVDYVGSNDSYVALIEQIAAASNTASRICAREELKQGLDTALRALPTDYETVLRLYELDGLSGQEVAERMGRSHGAVRMLLARAREQLVEVLGSDSRFFRSRA